MRTLLAVMCIILATACSASQIITPPPAQSTGGTAALRALPNMIDYPRFNGDYGYFGNGGRWPGGKPTHCDDLAKEHVSGLTQVGFITHIRSDATASVGSVGPTAGSVRVFTGLRTPPPNTVVIVAEPYGGCFVVYSPMV